MLFTWIFNHTSFNPDDDDYYEAKWLGTSMAWIDPLKEANANMINLASGGSRSRAIVPNRALTGRPASTK